jgi:hypothetical protein
MVNRNEYIEAMRHARDEKVRNHLNQYAPIWLAHEEVDVDKDSLIFEVVFEHPRYRWVKRRYWFDYFTDVLHHRGQLMLAEDDVLDIIADEPFIESASSNSVLAYGG